MAQEKEKSDFSLKDAISHALKHNTNIKNADLNIAAAKWKKWETTTIGLPQIDGKIEYKNNVILPDEFSQGGGENPLMFIFPKQQLSPSVTLTQLIFSGTYLVGLESSKVFLEISKNAKTKTETEIKKAVTSMYSSTLLVKESIELTNKNIANINNNIIEANALFSNGLTEEETIEQLELTLNNLENTKKQLEKLKEITISSLKLLIGLEDSKPLKLADSLTELTQEKTTLGSFSQQLSVFNNIDYKIAENNVEAKRLLYKYEKARILPTLAGFANLNSLGIGTHFKDIVNGDFFTTGTLGLSLNIPIFSSFRSKSRKEQAKLEWEMSKNSLTNSKVKIALDIRKVSTELELAQNTLNNAKRNLELSERIEQKNSIKYKEGIASSFELNQAQLQLYSSQNQYLQAMVNVINKQAELNALKN